MAAPAASAASVAAVAPVAASGKFYGPGCSDAFLVEHIERGQGNVRDFFFTESDFVIISGVQRQHIHCRSTGCGGCAARQ